MFDLFTVSKLNTATKFAIIWSITEGVKIRSCNLFIDILIEGVSDTKIGYSKMI
jgi:hypothetical protein